MDRDQLKAKLQEMATDCERDPRREMRAIAAVFYATMGAIAAHDEELFMCHVTKFSEGQIRRFEAMRN